MRPHALALTQALTLSAALVAPALVAPASSRPGTRALLASDLDLPRHTFTVEGGTVELQGGVTRDPDVKPTAFGAGRYPTLYFIRATNVTADTVWIELLWNVDQDTEFPARSRPIPPRRFFAFFEPSDGVPHDVDVKLRVFADRDLEQVLGLHRSVMKFASRDRRRLMKSIPSPLSNEGTEESFGHGGGVPILSGWPAEKSSIADSTRRKSER